MFNRIGMTSTHFGMKLKDLLPGAIIKKGGLATKLMSSLKLTHITHQQTFSIPTQRDTTGGWIYTPENFPI